MNKDTPITFEELYRLSVERYRYVKQREEDVTKLQKLTSDIDKLKLVIEKGLENISLVEDKIKAVGWALARSGSDPSLYAKGGR